MMLPFFLCLLTTILTCYARKPTLIVTPENIFPAYKQQLTLECIADGDPYPTVTWYLNGSVVETQRDKPATSNRILKFGKLLFLSFSQDDEGYYFCNATNIHGWVSSTPVLVKAASFNTKNARGPKDQYVHESETVVMSCIPPTGDPVPDTKWVHNNEPVNISTRIQLENGAKRLIIYDVKCSDVGDYHCLSSNVAGTWKSDKSTIKIKLKSPLNSAFRVQAFVGSSVEIKCNAPFESDSTIIWRRDKTIIPQAVLIDRRTIRIDQIRLSDSGDYICQVDTSSGPIEGVTQVVVIDPPDFLVTPQDKTTNEKSDIIFDCATSGTPNPTVRWSHNGRVMWVPQSPEVRTYDKRFHVYSNGSLKINNLQTFDSGTYECKASQQSGVKKTSATLSVIPMDVISIPIIEIGPQNQTLIIGSDVIVSCSSQCLLPSLSSRQSYYPASRSDRKSKSVVWYINGINIKNLNDSRFFIANSETLQIIDVQPKDSGFYTCELICDQYLNNEHRPSRSSWNASIVVESHEYSDSSRFSLHIPPPPQSVLVSAIGDFWVELKVKNSRENSSNIQLTDPMNIQVEAYDYSSNNWITSLYTLGDGIIRFDNVSPNTEYLFAIRNVNKAGAGRPYVFKNSIRTMEVRIDRQLSNAVLENLQHADFVDIRLESLSPSEMIAEWSFAGATNIIPSIDGVIASIQAVSLADCVTFSSSETDNPSNFRLNTDKDIYSCTDTSKSGIIGSKPFSSPCSLMYSLGKSQAFENPPEFLHSEQVYYRTSSISGLFSPSRMILSNLTAFMCYTVHLKAFVDPPNSDRLYSQLSSSVSSVTFDAPPSGAPRLYNIQWNEEDSCLYLSWNPPPLWERGGIISGYSIRPFSIPSDPSRYVHVDASSTSYCVKHLDEFHNYTIYLAAINCRGEGVRSLPIHVYVDHFVESDTTGPRLDSSRPVSPLAPGRNRGQIDYSDDNDHPMKSSSSSSSSNRVQRRVVYAGYDSAKHGSPGILSERDWSSVGDVKPRSSTSSLGSRLIQEPWLIITVILFSLLWVFVCLGLVLCSRYRNRRHRRLLRRPGAGGGAFATSDNGTGEVIAKNGRFIGGGSPPGSYSLAYTTGSPSLSSAQPPYSMMPGDHKAFAASQSPFATAFNDSTSLVDPLLVMSAAGNNQHRGVGIYPTLMNGTAPVHNGVCVAAPSPNLSTGSMHLTASGSSTSNHPTTNSSGQSRSQQQYPPPVCSSVNDTSVMPQQHYAVSSYANSSVAPPPFTSPTPFDSPRSSEPNSLNHRHPPAINAFNHNEDLDDSVTPYASVSVVHPLHNGCHPAKLSLAQVIPPPPDYPPPSVPTGSDDDEEEADTHDEWPQGHSLPSNGLPQETSSYYVHGDMSSVATPRSVGMPINHLHQSSNDWSSSAGSHHSTAVPLAAAPSMTQSIGASSSDRCNGGNQLGAVL